MQNKLPHSSASTQSAPINENRWGTATEQRVSVVALVITFVICAMVVVQEVNFFYHDDSHDTWLSTLAHIIFLAIVVALIYGSFVYQFTRLGYIRRRMQHSPASRNDLDVVFVQEQPKSLTVLVPSYREERRTILQTVLSAALQAYPNRRVVLLIDDPQKPNNAHDMQLLADAREIPAHITAAFQQPLCNIRESYNAYLETNDTKAATCRIAHLYAFSAEVVSDLLNLIELNDHVDTFFANQILAPRAQELLDRSRKINEIAHERTLTVQEIHLHFHYLIAIFDVEISSFERKRYVNLSHEPNKAMNLNSYIGLVGKRWVEEIHYDGIHLVEAFDERALFDFAPTDFYITLDADSLLFPDYALRLMHEMAKPENSRVAVIQTPYSSFPGTQNSLERIAGATTDIQYIIHQGFSQYNATFWVGANALLRAKALNDIASQDVERGFPIVRFIQDRTVIEDTESTIDLVEKNWTLHNYPERLAYSATPPDYGALLIQRRRWANGGLIILPKLLRYWANNVTSLATWKESFFRFHYLTSIAMVNFGLLILLAFPFQQIETSALIPLTALPYFFMYTRDLILCGYRTSDIFRVYALNLVMLPVNLGGVLKSIQQAVTRKKIPFGRTPKINGRTAAPALYVVVTFGLLLNWYVGMTGDILDHLWAHAAFALINASFLLFGIHTFMGWKESWQDIKASSKSPTPFTADASVKPAKPALDTNK